MRALHFRRPSEDLLQTATPKIRDVPVECELCMLHDLYQNKPFCHVHNVEFNDCLTFGPTDDMSSSWLQHSEDTAALSIRAAESTQFAVSDGVLRRQQFLIERVMEAINRSLDEQALGQSLPWWAGQGLLHKYPTGPTSPPEPPQPSPDQPKMRPPVWLGRSCDTCSLHGDFGSYVHMHLPGEGLCFTFGERGRKPVLIEAPGISPLGDGESDDAQRSRRELQTRLENRIRSAVTTFYGDQNHLARHRNKWKLKRRKAGERGLGDQSAEHRDPTVTAHLNDNGEWKHRCCLPSEDLGYQVAKHYP